MYNLNKLLQECIDDLESLGVQVGYIDSIDVNTRLTSTWGRCHKWGNSYTIEINQILMNEFQVSKQAIMDTVMHETIHTVKGCMNHGENFKKVAGLVNSFYGYNIQRCTSAAEKGLQGIKKYPPVKYTVKCQACGGECGYRKETKAIKIIKAGNLRMQYHCGHCGSAKLVVKNH